MSCELSLSNTKLLDALSSRNTGRPPLWIMRQAGRYLPEYRKLREKFTFDELFRTPELAAEVTLQPIHRFGFDAAIIFSDILVLADPLNLGLSFQDTVGPVLKKPIQSINDLHIGNVVDSLQYVSRAIKLVKKEIDVPLLGFCGAPFTVASYFIEGGSSKKMKQTKRWMYHHTKDFHALLQVLTEMTIDYLNMQIDAGVDAIQIFESSAGVLSYPHFREFSMRYIKEIIDRISLRNIPLIVYCKNTSAFLSELASLLPSCISLDWNCDMQKARAILYRTIALQGNLDPDLLYGPKEVIQREAKNLLNAMHGDPGFILNLGHGILPDTPLDSVYTLVECCRSYEFK